MRFSEKLMIYIFQDFFDASICVCNFSFNFYYIIFCHENLYFALVSENIFQLGFLVLDSCLERPTLP